MSDATETRKARVLDVGQCNPDHQAIASMLMRDFFAEVDRAATVPEAMDAVRKQSYDLVLVNRIIFQDGSDGLDLIRQAKREELTVPIMLVSNYEDAQLEAVAVGGVQGFGKASLHAPRTREHLLRFLPVRNVAAM